MDLPASNEEALPPKFEFPPLVHCASCQGRVVCSRPVEWNA
jgi:hypothetical protein